MKLMLSEENKQIEELIFHIQAHSMVGRPTWSCPGFKSGLGESGSIHQGVPQDTTKTPD